jgi:serine protease
MRVVYLLLALAVGGGTARADEIVPGRLIVRTRSHLFAATRGRVLRHLAADTHVVALDGVATEAETRAAAAALASDPDVVWAEPDGVRRRAAGVVKPDDPMYQYQWGLPLVRAPEAWSRTTGSADVVVAIVDSGFLSHDDLKARIIPGYDFISDADNAGDGDGRDPDATDPGTADEASSAQHGVHIAGIVGATSNNTLGISGVDWACRLLPVRVLGVQAGRGVDSDIADAVRWAAGIHVDGVPDNATPAQVINMSFSGTGHSSALQAAIDDVVARGAIVIAAAGNTAADAGDTTPGGLKNVITVGAVDPTGTIASYSNFGPSVAIMAPGGAVAGAGGVGTDAQGILSTLSTNQYVYYAGTSQAAGFVSATAALLKAVRPDLNATRVRAILEASADPTAKCTSPIDPALNGCGAGLLDIDAALVVAVTGVGPGATVGAEIVGGCAFGPGAPRGGFALALVILLLALRRRALL